MERDAIERIGKHVVGLSLPLVALAFAIGGVRMGLGGVAGAGVAVANFAALRWLIDAISTASDRERAAIMILLVLKMGAVLGITALLIRVVDTWGFFLGTSALVLGVVIGSVRSHRSSPDAGDADESGTPSPSSSDTSIELAAGAHGASGPRRS